MSAIETSSTAPSIVRKVGYYLLALSALGISATVTAATREGAHWSRFALVGLTILSALGLVMQRRWGYVAALLLLGLNVVILGIWGVLIVVHFSEYLAPFLAVLFWTLNLLLVLPIALLLRLRVRRWFFEEHLAGQGEGSG